MKPVKKKHHYVWAEYLRGWAQGNNVWYLTEKGKIANDSVKGLARTNDFYKIDSLTDNQIFLLQAFIFKLPNNLQESPLDLLNGVIYIQNFERIMREINISDKEIEDTILRLRSNLIEDIHAFHENEVKEVIRLIRSKPEEVKRSDIFTPGFMSFFGHQLTRTKSSRSKLVGILKRLAPLLPKEMSSMTVEELIGCANVLSFILGENVGKNMYFSSNDFNLTVLINNCSLGFITSDNPVVNISHDEMLVKNSPPERYDAFYPVNERVGLLIHEGSLYPKGVYEVVEKNVIDLNAKMAGFSDAHIFGKSKADIDGFKRIALR